LQAVYAAHPERFVKGLPPQKKTLQVPEAVWINPPLAANPVATAETAP
jgi:hypothetical protein